MADRLTEGLSVLVEIAARQAKHLYRRVESRALVDNEVVQMHKLGSILTDIAKLRMAQNEGREDELSRLSDAQLENLARTYLAQKRN